VQALIKSLIAVERKALGKPATEALAVESLVLKGSSTNPDAAQLILKEAEKDPTLRAVVNAARVLK
jgi:hypothetical protein